METCQCTPVSKASDHARPPQSTPPAACKLWQHQTQALQQRQNDETRAYKNDDRWKDDLHKTQELAVKIGPLRKAQVLYHHVYKVN
eukprot:1153097-Pelagomonas_calceolata.AAC.4